MQTSITKMDFDSETQKMFSIGVDYSSREPQTNLMEGNCVFRLFARRFKVPVVVYFALFDNASWSTMFYRVDGSAFAHAGVDAQTFGTYPLQLVNYYTFQNADSNNPCPSTISHCVILEEEPVTRWSAITAGCEIAKAMADSRKTLVVTECLRETLVWKDILAELEGVSSSGIIERFDRCGKEKASNHGCYLPLAMEKESRTKRLAENNSKRKPNYKNFLEGNNDYPNKLAYWKDIAMEEVTPTFYAKFLEHFRLSKYLPAGEGCLHKHLGGPRDRPLLGPLAFLGPSEAVTPIHEDGGGTVDSAHLNVEGHNQILIFPRMKADQCKVARTIMGLDQSMGWKNRENLWPTLDMLRRLLAQRIIPVSVVLSPGELLHINKGRLHCFMKAFAPPTPTPRPARAGTACNPPETPALSIAWDWVNIGVEGTCDEVSYSLERSAENRTEGLSSLARPETCLIKMLLKMKLEDVPPRLLEDMKRILTRQTTWCSLPTQGGGLTVMQVTDEDVEVHEDPSFEKLKEPVNWKRACMPVPIADSFLCAVCYMELSNVYFQCGGCRALLNHNFLVCGFCYKAGKHKGWKTLQHSFSPQFQSSMNHIVNSSPSKWLCGACDLLCQQCKKCVKCQCFCHTKFVLRFRFLHSAALQVKLHQLNTYMDSK
jgi:hypothetical protein